MKKLTNISQLSLVLRDENGKSITIAPKESIYTEMEINENHLFFSEKMIVITDVNTKSSSNTNQPAETLKALQAEYEQLFGKKPDNKLNQKALQQLIEKEKERIAEEHEKK